ncbi:MAG: T9SS type A sorting domain-containing protein [Prolixibacteraceae bacterium]|nr:T9SS type A sorting domain-containing protein [Prolixibacteraceae bacterium]
MKKFTFLFTLFTLAAISCLAINSNTARAGLTNTMASENPANKKDNPDSIQVDITQFAIDSLALVALYHSTNGASWDDNTNWLTGPLSTWYGVTVRGGRVTKIWMERNNVTGQLPTEIGDLTALDSLNLGNNDINFTLPVELWNLTEMQVLYLYNNSFSDTMPAQIGYLTKIKKLSLAGNELSGDIPPQIGLLTDLENLNFGGNLLSGDIPPEIGNLTKLEYCFLNENQLTSIPSEIGNCTNLANLYLQRNQISSPLPPEIGQCTHLVNLVMEQNQISGSIPAEIGNLTSLSTFNIHTNNLSGEIPPEIGSCTRLYSLSLYNNNLSGEIPAEIGNLTGRLRRLHIQENQLSGEIPPELGNCTLLESLYLNNNQLTGEIPQSFENLDNLNYCRFDYNQLRGDLPSSLTEMVERNASKQKEETSQSDGNEPKSSGTKPTGQQVDGFVVERYLNINYNYFTFANIEASGILPDDLSENFVYNHQDTLLAIEIEGSNLTVVDGNATNNTYRWYKDNVLLTADTRTIAAEGVGEYRARVNNTDYPNLTLYSDTVLYFGPTIPVDRQVSDMTYSDGESDCFDAYNIITVAGDGTDVILQNGSSATFIAGYSVRFLPGFHAHSGSYMDAHITETGIFCNSEPPGGAPIVENTLPDTYKSKNIEQEKSMGSDFGAEPLVKVYPNPTRGETRFELKRFEEPVNVRLFNSTGALVEEVKQVGNSTLTLHLNHLRKGLYIVNIENSNFRKISKLMVE